MEPKSRKLWQILNMTGALFFKAYGMSILDHAVVVERRCTLYSFCLVMDGDEQSVSLVLACSLT